MKETTTAAKSTDTPTSAAGRVGFAITLLLPIIGTGVAFFTDVRALFLGILAGAAWFVIASTAAAITRDRRARAEKRLQEGIVDRDVAAAWDRL